MKSLRFEGNQKSNVIAPLLLMAFLVSSVLGGLPSGRP